MASGMWRGTDERSADAPEMVDRLGGLAWACLFALALVAFLLVTNF